MLFYNYGSREGKVNLPVQDNWEEDVQDIKVESCDEQVDPSGYRVVYCKDPLDICVPDDNNYSIGASHLKNRLNRIKRAGYEAPMTKKALNLLRNSKKLGRFLGE